MSGGRVDAELCRRLAEQCGYHSGLNPTEKRQAGEQLTAAADLAERLVSLRDEWRKHADREWIGESFVDDLDGLLAAATADLAQRPTLTEERARQVVLAAIGDEMRLVPAAELPALYDAIATRAAKELAGAVVGLSAEEREALQELRDELRNDWEGVEGHEQPGLAVLDLLLSGPAVNPPNAHHACPSPVGLNKTERMAAQLAASDKQLRAERPELCKLLDRLLGGGK